MVVGLQFEAERLGLHLQVLGKFCGHVEGKELGAAAARGFGVDAADLHAAEVGVELGSAGHAQHVAQGKALGVGHVDGLANRSANRDS